MAKRAKKRSRKKRARITDSRIQTAGSVVLDNVKVGLFTRDNWYDMGWALLGGLFYVVVPTAIQRAGVRVNPPDSSGESSYTIKWWDINGWPVFWIGTGGGLLLGAALRQPGFMAGALGTGTAHILFTKLNRPVIKRFFGIYAARLDALSTSSMGDAGVVVGTTATPAELQPGAVHKKINGRDVVVYDQKQLPESTAPQGAELSDNHQQNLKDGFEPTVESYDDKESSGWGDKTPADY